jgi:poly-gamma-glutamate capsule biosynthesis protein CapA/YwtB (metallophosphatase superfamily)
MDKTEKESADARHITIFLCGDVMTGRGIDQVLPHPGAPLIYEPYMKSAKGYVELAELKNGPIKKPVDFSYIWGDALDELNTMAPDARIINLETAVTKSEDYEDKGINYRMNPENISCITAARIDCCTLANNHLLDWGYSGLIETLETLRKAGLKGAGAGRDQEEAATPALIYVRGKGRVIVFSFGATSSGIPSHWAASKGPGVNLLKDFSEKTIRQIAGQIRQIRQPGDVIITSIHWGGNWGYFVDRDQMDLGRQLIDEAGVDIIHGHSSHHVKGIEVYRQRLILYGCGDFLNDYEGIAGLEHYRGDLGLMYFATVDPSGGGLISLKMTPTQIKHLRVNRASQEDAMWLRDVLNREGERFGTNAESAGGNLLSLRWSAGRL